MKHSKIVKTKLYGSCIKGMSLIMLLLFTLSSISYSQTCEKSKEQASLSKTLTKLSWNADLEQISKIIDENPDALNQRLKNDETMLTIAAWQGNTEIAKYLVEKGIDVNLRNNWNNNALHNASTKGNDEIATLVLQHGGNVNARGSEGSTALHMAAVNDQSSTVKLLLDAGADVNASNDYNQTPLVQASWKGNPEIVWLLTEKGAQVNYAAMAENTILHNLASNGNAKSVAIVMAKGANANSVDKEGKLPLHNAVMNRNHEAAWKLLASTSNINLQETNLGNTPLHMAGINGDMKITEMLIKAGADASVQNKHGKTPVDYAVKYGYADVVAYYISNDLSPAQSLKQAQENQVNALKNMSNEEAKVVYCGHSGWAVETENHFLIFDYWSEAHSENLSLVNGSISPEELQDKHVIVFASHDHSDHYDPVIHTWAGKIENINYVYGFKPEESWMHKKEAYKGPDYIYIDNNTQQTLDGVKITAFKSTDSGQGFLVESDGLTIYHPGDHAWFADEDELAFKQEVDFVAARNAKVDIAFLPVTGCPSRWTKENIVAGFKYSLDKLDPKQVFPMHALQREYTMKEFAELADEHKSQSQVVCTENIGDSYRYNKTVVAAK